jgi:hypothetical protein
MAKTTAHPDPATDKTHTVLEAGYYHIRHHDIPLAQLPYAPAEADTAYLFYVKPEKTMPALPEGAVTFRDKDATCILVPSGVPIPSIAPEDVGAIQKLIIESPEADDLAYGLMHQGNSISKVAILVDDFGLPSGISDHLHRLIPESYTHILATCNELEDKEPLLISERKARNQGTRRVKSVLDKISSAPAEAGALTTHVSAKIYAEKGFVLGDRPVYGTQETTCGNGSLVFSTPYLLDTRSRHADESGFGVIQKPYVGLTRSIEDSDAFVPACAVLHMGLIKQLKEMGYSNIISVNSTEMDGHIHNKCFEGAVLAAHFLDEPPQGKGQPICFENTLITRDVGFFGGEVITRINSQDVRQGGVRQESMTPSQFTASLAATGSTPLEAKHLPFAEFNALLQQRGVTPLYDGVRMEITSLNAPAPSCAIDAPEASDRASDADTPGASMPFTARIRLSGEQRGGGAMRG